MADEVTLVGDNEGQEDGHKSVIMIGTHIELSYFPHPDLKHPG